MGKMVVRVQFALGEEAAAPAGALISLFPVVSPFPLAFLSGED
jgi:hypothetical protein